MRNKNTIKLFLFFICISIMLTGCSNGDTDHIDADDIGIGKNIRLKVKPNASASSDVIKGDGEEYTTTWLNTGLFVTGQTYDDEGTEYPPKIGLSLSGLWYPWGIKNSIVAKECLLTTCGQSSDDRCKTLDDSTPVIKSFLDNGNCYFAKGHGVYILVAQQQSDGSYSDPNQSFDTASGPSVKQGFYTAHIGDFKADQTGVINIDKFWSCTPTPSGDKIVCDSINIDKLIGGKIYLKLSDSYYVDNDSSLSEKPSNPYIGVNIKTGVFYPNFVSATLKAFRNTIETISYAVKNAILASLQDIIFVVIMLYFVITAFGFMTGIVKLNQTEAVVRLLKIGVVAMLTSPNNIITTGFVGLYQNLAEFAADIISNNLPYMPNVSSYDSSSGGTFGNQIGYLAIYDIIFNQIISKSIHTKIWALLFTESFWCIPALYILLSIIVVVVFRSLLIYIMAYIQLSIGILILPIFAVMLLFKITAGLFEKWLQHMVDSALMIVVGTMGMGLTLSLMDNILSTMLTYAVTWTNWFWFLGWWFPDNEDTVSNAISPSNYFFALISALICKSFVENILQMTNSLSGSNLARSSDAFRGLWQVIGGKFSSVGETLRSVNAKYLTGALLNHRYNKDGSGEGKSILDKWQTTRNRADLLYKKSIANPIKYGKDIVDPRSVFSSTKHLKEKELQQELNILKSQNKYNGISANKYSDLIRQKENTLYDKLSKITVSDRTGASHEISLKDGEYKLPDGTTIGTKDQIEDAIKGNATHNGCINIQYANIGDARTALNQKLQELSEVKKDLEQITKRK